jgi:hypothetical protein
VLLEDGGDVHVWRPSRTIGLTSLA